MFIVADVQLVGAARMVVKQEEDFQGTSGGSIPSV